MTANTPADSLLGQLQRGCGRGFLNALQEDVTIVRPLLLDCVTHDPRWDRQFESRSGYYATLIMQITLPLDPLDAYLRACSENDLHDSEDLVLETICALAIRGDVSALAIARAYLTYGRYWYTAFATLMEVPNASLSIDEVSRVIDQRFPDDEMLDDELFCAGSYTQQEPWLSLRLISPRVSRILSGHEMRAQQQQQQKERLQMQFANLPISELLAVSLDHRTARFAAQSLHERVTTADLDLLLDVAQQGEYWQRIVAFRGLQHLAHPAALAILQAFFQSSDTQPGGAIYGAAARAIAALPSNVTLDLARAWFDTEDGPRRRVALQILEAHATAADVGRVRNALLLSLSRDTPDTYECYMQCSMLKILARFPEAGPYPEVETVFKEAGYAPTRIYAAQVLNTSDRDQFARGLALECLWDCEEDVRRIGCECVNLDVPEAHARLVALAHDPHEEVREAANERLGTCHN